MDNDFGIMVLQRWQLPHPVQEKESLWRSMHSMNQPAPQDKGFFPFTSWTVPFTLLCLASLYPLLLHFQGNHCSKPTTLGTSQRYTVQVPVRVHVGWCVVNICRHHSCSGHWKRERDADLTLSQASFTYIYLNLSEGQNAGNRECRICHQV